MPQGDKSKYTDKQDRKAEHIEKSYESRGVPEKEAERRAWATVNKDDGGGKRPGGSGRGKSTGHPAAHKGGHLGGAASASRSPASRSEAAKKAAATRKRNAAHAAHYLWSLNRLSSGLESLLIGGLAPMAPWGRCQLSRCSQRGSSAARSSEVL
jgi:plasmid stabilization system protein ParE